MSNEDKFQIAKQYVDKQLETMKQYGAAPDDLSQQEYKALIEDVAENIRSLDTAADRRDKIAKGEASYSEYLLISNR